MTWERSGIRYVKRVDDTSVDEAVVEQLVQHRAAVSSYLGLNPPADAVLTYHKYLDRDDLKKRSHCSPMVAGCYFATHGVETRHRLDRHELVHAYTNHLGDKPKLVEEGLAEVLSCDKPSRPPREVALEAAWSLTAWQSTQFADIERMYQAGAAWVGYLLQNKGPDSFMRFYTSLAAGDEFAQAATKFEQVYAEPLASSWLAAMANRNADGGCVFPFECQAPPYREHGARDAHLGAPVSTPGASGARTNSNADASIRTLSSDGLSLIQVEVASQPADGWRLGTCDTTRLNDADLGRDPTGRFRADTVTLGLAPGRYWFPSDAVTVTEQPVTEQPLARAFGAPEACPVLEPLVLSKGVHLLGVSRESLTALGQASADTEVRDWTLRLDTGLHGGRVKVECSPGVRLEVCETCAYTACQVACETSKSGVARGDMESVAVPAVLRIHLQADTGFWLRLGRQHAR